MVLTGEFVDAAVLEGWGVVDRVWDDDDFEERARGLARRLAEGPTLAHAATKEILRVPRGGVSAADDVVPETSGGSSGRTTCASGALVPRTRAGRSTYRAR